VHIDLAEIIKWLFAAFVSLVGALLHRTVKRHDEDMKALADRVSAMETLKKDIMLRPDVLALYADQKEEFREKVKELRQDHKDLREEIGKKLDYVITRLDHRAKNERAEDP
jgi:hypothetical protein